jgi:hypothetical protein
MVRGPFLAAAFLISVTALAQQPNSNPTYLNGYPTGTLMITPGSSGGVLSTPNATFAAPQPTTGISVSDRAGANPAGSPLQTEPENTTVFYSFAPTVIPEYGVIATSNYNNGTAAAAASGGRLIYDMGPAVFTGSGPVSGGQAIPSGMSLADLANKYKQKKGQHRYKTYTNEDVRRITENISFRGTTVSRLTFDRALQEDRGETPTGTFADAAYEAAPAESARPVMISMVMSPEQTGSSTEQQQGAPTASQATQDQQQDSSNRLPATASFLPLLGLVGLVSGGVGVWLKSR